MIILGIDPGLATTGYGVIKKKGNSFELIAYDTIKTSPDQTDVDRLSNLYEELLLLIDKYEPEHIAVEELFFNKNVKTAIRVGQARGVILLAGSQKGIEVAEYTPLQVKQAVVGYGRASKNQVQQMVKALLNLDNIPKPDDAADALAISICHGHSYASKEKWGDLL
ncbi:MAG TPA: crossover junction endodeoxyribonuclease RuvC [Halanaerobiales bacterium]|nr:crossover junction endodeoxyribonuclease RuvC [Halanaerobiales bacterium]